MVKIFLLEEHLCSLLHQVVALGSRLILSVAPPGGVGDVAPPLALPYPIDDPVWPWRVVSHTTDYWCFPPSSPHCVASGRLKYDTDKNEMLFTLSFPVF